HSRTPSTVGSCENYRRRPGALRVRPRTAHPRALFHAAIASPREELSRRSFRWGSDVSAQFRAGRRVFRLFQSAMNASVCDSDHANSRRPDLPLHHWLRIGVRFQLREVAIPARAWQPGGLESVARELNEI